MCKAVVEKYVDRAKTMFFMLLEQRAGGPCVIWGAFMCASFQKSVVLFPHLSTFQKYENLGSVTLLVLNRKCLFL